MAKYPHFTKIFADVLLAKNNKSIIQGYQQSLSSTAQVIQSLMYLAEKKSAQEASTAFENYCAFTASLPDSNTNKEKILKNLKEDLDEATFADFIRKMYQAVQSNDTSLDFIQSPDLKQEINKIQKKSVHLLQDGTLDIKPDASLNDIIKEIAALNKQKKIKNNLVGRFLHQAIKGKQGQLTQSQVDKATKALNTHFNIKQKSGLKQMFFNFRSKDHKSKRSALDLLQNITRKPSKLERASSLSLQSSTSRSSSIPNRKPSISRVPRVTTALSKELSPSSLSSNIMPKKEKSRKPRVAKFGYGVTQKQLEQHNKKRSNRPPTN